MLRDRSSLHHISTEHVAPVASAKKRMRRLYARLERERVALLEIVGEAGEREEVKAYVSQLLRSLLFVSFLQRKGLLGTQGRGACDGEQDYLWQRLRLLQQRYGRGHFHDFYTALLHRLSGYQGQIQPASSRFAPLLSGVPELPAELFDPVLFPHNLPAPPWLSDEVFERLLRFVQELNWCLDDDPHDNDSKISPDIIGTLFEKHSKQKQVGAYYTQEDVTEYISKNSLIPRLFERVMQRYPELFCPGELAQLLLQSDPGRYLYPALKHGCELPLPPEIQAGVDDLQQRAAWDALADGSYALPLETWREVVTRRQRCKQLKTWLAGGSLTSIDEFVICNLDIRQFALDLIRSTRRSELLAAFYEGLQGLTVLDPTCGSGAFLLAALAVLEPLYAACQERFQEIMAVSERASEPSPDASAQALWSGGSVVGDNSVHYPNRRLLLARTILEKNLYGLDIMREAVAMCRLRFVLKLIARLESTAELSALADLRFNLRVGNALVGFATLSEVRASREADAVGSLPARPQDQSRDWMQEAEQLFVQRQQSAGRESLSAEQHSSLQQRWSQFLQDWRASLDRVLARSYGLAIKHMTAEQFEHWRATLQPFHWPAEWYSPVRAGGFDVIIGNPPYVSYSREKMTYQVQAFRTRSSGNLCAYILERAISLLCPRGRCGMIVPVSALASERYRSLSQFLLEKQIWISSYANRPARLFTGVEQRVAIVLLRNVDARAVWSSAYQHWYEAERAHLFATLSYTAATIWEPAGTPVKAGSELAEAIFSRLMQQRGFPLLNCQRAGAAVWVHNGPTYWVRALPFEPHPGPRNARSEHYCRLPVDNQEEAFILAAILNSSTFYFFYKLVSNCRDLGQKELRQFPLGELQSASRDRLAHLGHLLAGCLKASAEHRTRHYTGSGQRYASAYEEYYPARARDVLEQIDRVLAEHYGFTPEELDFLLHYESKYRQNQPI